MPSSPSRSLRSGVLWTFLGNTAANAAQFALVAGLAHLGSASTVGVYSLALSVTAPIFLLAGMQLRSVQATDARQEFDFGSYVALRSLCLVLALILVALLTAAYPSARAALLLFALAKLFEGLSDVLYGRLQLAERLDQVARSVLMRGLLGLALPLLAYHWLHSVAAVAGAVALANALVLTFYDLPRTAALRPGPWWSLRGLLRLLGLSWPLGVVMGLVSLGTSIPRLVIERDLGGSALGVYTALSYVNTAGALVTGAIGTALTTRLSQAFARQDRATFLRYSALFVLAAICVGLLIVGAAVLWGAGLLRLVFGAEFAHEAGVFVWLSVAGIFLYAASCAGYVVTAARRFLDQLPLFVAVTLVLLLGCWWLVPRWQLVGAALATMISALVQLAGSWWIVWRAVRSFDPALPPAHVGGQA